MGANLEHFHMLKIAGSKSRDYFIDPLQIFCLPFIQVLPAKFLHCAEPAVLLVLIAYKFEHIHKTYQ